MKKGILLISLLLSLALFFTVPIGFNWDYCAFCALIAVIDSVIIIRYDSKKINVLNFNVFFLFSLFCCSFVYPVFLIGSKSIIGSQLTYELETLNYINKCTAICTLAVSSYSLAYYIFRNHKKNATERLKVKASSIYQHSRIVVLVILILKAISVYVFRQENPDSINNSDTPYLDMIFSVVIPIYFVAAAIYIQSSNLKEALIKILYDNKIIISIILFLVISYLIIGDRGPIIILLMSLFAVVSLFIKPIKVRHLLFAGFIGILLMFGLRATRVGSDSLRDSDLSTVLSVAGDAIIESASPWDLLSDLIGISFELNEGMIITERNGYLHPMANVIRYIGSPIPFFSSNVIRAIYHIELDEVAAGSVIGKYTMTNAGNHAVIDLYMPFGYIGVLVGFFFFGWFVAKIANGYGRNIFCSFFYVYMISMAIYTPRSSFLTHFKSIFIAYVLYVFILQLSAIRKIR